MADKLGVLSIKMSTYFKVIHISAALNIFQDVLIARARKMDRFANLNKGLMMVAVNSWKNNNPILRLCLEIAENRANISTKIQMAML